VVAWDVKGKRTGVIIGVFHHLDIYVAQAMTDIGFCGKHHTASILILISKTF
jgi:hypothetical protein